MDCPKGHGRLKSATVESLRVNRCPACEGTWYDLDELRLLKDKEAHGNYNWIDFDLWKDAEKFRADRQRGYRCPRDGQPLTTVYYGESTITVDICQACEGIWLDKDEYEEIVAYLEHMVNTQSIGDYLNDVREEFVELFTGTEGGIGELRDLDKVLYLLELRFVVEHPRIATLLRKLPG